ncbi:MAG: DUF1501 domain-containing protein [Verrucomicrobia bacterium]|jgi:hypothetical protein|nr:DUF1501 domain-containing protein [Verrucomicrobiota bacterium]MDA0725192.1 DUF1501 domain-containing protein [Verrucomicrobiota bacterium]MDA1048757.1 DUF1501 domain-containing protein [Verrucomicrobiota bacterium]
MTERRFCDGWGRRDFLRIGAAGALGLNMSLPKLLQAEASGNSLTAKKDVSFIFVFLKGGLSTIDTFDMKPDAPSEIRGPFQSIPSNVPGTRVCEKIPNIAKVMDKFSIIRSFTHRNAGHGPADHYMLTGYHPVGGFDGGLKPNNQHPAMGSVISHKLGPRGAIPPYVCLPNMHNSGSSAYLGPEAAPFTIEADPSSPGFAVPDMQPPFSIEAKRIDDRRSLLSKVDRFHKSMEAKANRGTRELGVFAQRATELMTSKAAKEAFDINKESDKLRDAYGRNTLGQSCLMARRLVEAGVRCVTVEHSNWDTHYHNFQTLQDDLLPKFDQAIPTLFKDLDSRGLLQNTLVLLTGEFGRTPKINDSAGRDHWSRCFTVALAGAGIKGGRVLGKSDKWAMDPAEDPYGPEDLCATVYNRMGIDPRSEMHTPDGRPIMVTNNGRVIQDLL